AMIIQVTPRAMLNTFFRHRYKFASVFLLFFGAAAAYCFISTPKYESDASLLVKFAPSQPSRPSAPPSTGISAQQTERKEIINSQIGVLQSQDLLADVLKTLTIGTVYPSLEATPDPKVKLNNALTRLGKDLDVEADKDSNIILLTLLNPNADVSTKALN